MSTTYKLIDFVKLLKKNGYKLTDQRQAILKTLLKYPDKHFTVSELYKRVKVINVDIGLATVYRNLELFNRLNIVNKLNFTEEKSHYELKKFQVHHHMICIECEKIIEFNAENLQDFEEDLENKYDFTIVDHYIKFFGYCQACQDKKKKKI